MCTAALCSLAGGLVLAQQSGATPLAPDSAELYTAFFYFHDDFSRWLDQTKAAAPAVAGPVSAAQALDLSVAAHFKIDNADLGKMTGVTQSVMAQFKIIDRDWQTYFNSRAKYEQFPDPATLQQFAQRRSQAAMDGVSQLQKVLSPSSWTGLHDYINNIHRPRYRNVPVPKR